MMDEKLLVVFLIAAKLCYGQVLRLVGGNWNGEGRVEIFYNGNWGTVCDDDWGITDARVVCRQLGFLDAVTAPNSARFGAGSGQIWLDNVRCSGSESSIENCPHRGWGIENCEHDEDASVICSTDISGIKLVGGSWNGEGRVEISSNGNWGTVCDDYWDIKDARVVCRQLGFLDAVSAPTSAHFGAGSGQIWLDDVDCSGSERSIVNCKHRGWGVENCGHSEDASVICSRVRLVGGSWEGEGRVEIFYNGNWGTVCDKYWEMTEARVVCRQMGFPDAVSAPRSAHFGIGSGPIWLNNVYCSGSENSIEKCWHRGWGVEDCDHNQDASVICSNLRLVGGNWKGEGRVEIFHNGSWGTVCDDDWDINDAQVVCRQLGFPFAASAPGFARFGAGSGQIWLDDVGCLGSEASIVNCFLSTWGSHNCEHSEDASVICSRLRLAGGSWKGEGRVEIFYNGKWGTVCDDYWDMNDARVVCRQLRFPDAVSAPRSAHFGSGSGQVWLDDVGCSGSESTIENCPHAGWGVKDCSHNEEASVICSRLRLVGGSWEGEGRVEIFYNGNWGTVCDNNWDIREASVVCRQLGFPYALSAPISAHFGAGTGQVWQDNLHCSGSESTIVNCVRYGRAMVGCNHNKDASVICSRIRLVGGSWIGEGRVEIFYNGKWGTVCDDYWDTYDARVVCRQMGFLSNTATALDSAHFGSGSGQIWLDNVDCSGSESTIVNCQHSGWGVESCDHSEDASVICSTGLRLVGGGWEGEGRVELFLKGNWGTVCDHYWDIKDARVVCRQLGFPDAVSAPSSARFGRGSGKIWLTSVACSGSESLIVNCPQKDWEMNYCSHSEDASVICSRLRLVDGSWEGEGRVEIFYNSNWGTVCDNSWDMNDARVVCRQLGFPDAISAPHSARFGSGSGNIWLDHVRCSGNENSILHCSHNGWGSHNCGHSEDASVICSRLRLVGGSWEGEGRVEIFYNGNWGTVCDDYWDMNDARVICRQLGFPNTVSAPHSAHFGSGSGQVWLDNVGCSGSESTIVNCQHRGWGVEDCSHSDDASVVCSRLRLVGGSRNGEGRVEIFYNGKWGTVCDDDWDMNDARVVCQHLGFSNAVRALGSAHFGAGSGEVWLDNVGCSGSESSIENCSHNGWGVGDCTHKEDASVTCSST